MSRYPTPLIICAAAAFALAACSTHGPRRHRRPRQQWHPAVDMLLKYDLNHDGTITRAELMKGLRADFAKADTNHDGRLDEAETRAVNEARWAKDASTASPLVDWNHDGYVEFDEFAAAPLSLFAELDKNGDGMLSPAELRAGRMGPKHPKSKRRHSWRGRRGRGGQGDGGDGDGD